MKLFTYENCTELRELVFLCKKILKSGDTCEILAGNKAQDLSDALWRTHPFLPHGLNSEDYASIQPVLISSKYNNRQVVVNFEEIYVQHTQIQCKAYILWNVKSAPQGFTKYLYDKGKWTLVK